MPQPVLHPSLFLSPLGDSAVVLQFGKEISLAIHARILAVVQLLEQQPFRGLVDFVPAFTTLTVYYDPWELSRQGTTDAYSEVVRLLEILVEQAAVAAVAPGRLIEIPVVYGGAFGPDLQEVAEYAGLSMEEVVRIHCNVTYQVYMIGFAPGFPYLGGMDARIAAPRKSKPRESIPAGSVGIAGAQTGVYSISTPGGWQLIGRTPRKLFDPVRQEPSLLQTGDKVRFVPISEAEFQSGREGQV